MPLQKCVIKRRITLNVNQYLHLGIESALQREFNNKLCFRTTNQTEGNRNINIKTRLAPCGAYDALALVSASLLSCTKAYMRIWPV